MAKQEKKPVRTRFDERTEKIYAENINNALGKYLIHPATRRWKQKAVNEHGELVEVEKHEYVMSTGRCIDKADLARLQFFIQAGELTYIEVSNQLRSAHESGHVHMIAMVSAAVGQKTVKLIMHALNIDMALDIARDWIELNYDKPFTLTSVKVSTDYYIIEETLLMLQGCEDQDALDMEFANAQYYEVVAKTKCYKKSLPEDQSYESTHTFLCRTADADVAKTLIQRYIIQNANKREPEEEHLATVTLVEAKICSYTKVIPYEFSVPYVKKFKFDNLEGRRARNEISQKEYEDEKKRIELIGTK